MSNVNDFPIDDSLKELIANIVRSELKKIGIEMVENEYLWFKFNCAGSLGKNKNLINMNKRQRERSQKQAESDEPIVCEYCGYLTPDHEERCLKSPETKAQLMVNEHLKFNENENAAICNALITVNMIKAVLGNGDLMAYYSSVRNSLMNRLTPQLLPGPERREEDI